jgi:23S rRNA (adenine2503-C2)-methyltransferase
VSAVPQLKDEPIESLRAKFAEQGIERFRADQVAAWIYQRGVDDPAAMTDLSQELRARLAAEWQSRALEIDETAFSRDGTIKAVLRAADGARVESVLIPEEERTTLCVSTQVGCPMACSFCATGTLGFTRNLSAAEIVDQYCRMRELVGAGRRITNIVFMGMGEPLLNPAAVHAAIRILVHPKGAALAPRRITVSTVGVVPQIDPLLAVAPIHLALSLHATTDAVREQLVPLNRRYPLDVLLGALRASEHVNKRRPIFVEYTLIEGVNDAIEDARRLPRLLAGLPVKINLIPMNAHADADFRAPSEEGMDRFLRELAGAGLRVTLRRSRGPDIDAACGQLALRKQGRSAA